VALLCVTAWAFHKEWRMALRQRRSERHQVFAHNQINGRNFNQLQVAWRFKTDEFGTRPEYKLEETWPTCSASASSLRAKLNYNIRRKR
jgi:glucose dehydrogenase